MSITLKCSNCKTTIKVKCKIAIEVPCIPHKSLIEGCFHYGKKPTKATIDDMHEYMYGGNSGDEISNSEGWIANLFDKYCPKCGKEMDWADGCDEESNFEFIINPKLMVTSNS